jgi:hypothetical protein
VAYVVECLLSVQEALGLSPNIAREKKSMQRTLPHSIAFNIYGALLCVSPMLGTSGNLTIPHYPIQNPRVMNQGICSH